MTKRKEPVRIDRWYTQRAGDAYTAPETSTLHLSGVVTGHPSFEDGEKVTTSAIRRVKGRLVYTCSGRVYYLGRPSRKWTAWLRERGTPYNPKAPIRTRRARGV